MVAARSSPDVVDRVRAICLGFPDSTEKPFGGHLSPAFRVHDKMFLVVSEDRESFTCKAPPGVQRLLVGSEPDRYFVPRYVGSKGWVGVRLDPGIESDEVAELAEESYRLVAPKRLVAMLDRSVPGACD